MRTIRGALALALTLTIGGCNVTVGNQDRQAQRAAVADVVGDGELTVDLSDPPSRDDLALGPGRSSVILEREGGTPFDLTVLFTDGTRLSVPVVTVGVYADGPDADPTKLIVRRAGDDLAGVRTALDEAVADLGVDAVEADRAHEAVSGAREGESDVRRSLTAGVASPERLSLQPAGKSSRDEYVVDYTVEWGSS